MAKQERKGRNGARHGRRRWTLGAGVAAAVVVALIVGWFAYRAQADLPGQKLDRKSTRLNSSHVENSYAVFCLKKKILRRQGPQLAAGSLPAQGGHQPHGG